MQNYKNNLQMSEKNTKKMLKYLQSVKVGHSIMRHFRD